MNHGGEVQQMHVKYKVESIETSDHVVTKITPYFVSLSNSHFIRQDSHETFTTSEDPCEVNSPRHTTSHDPNTNANQHDPLDSLSESISQIYLSGAWRQRSGGEHYSTNEHKTVSSNKSKNCLGNQDIRNKLPSIPVSNLTESALKSLDHSNENYLSSKVNNWVIEVEQSYFGGVLPT